MKNIKATALGIGTAIAISISSPVLAQNSNKAIALDLLQRGLIEGDLQFIKENVAPDYIQHNPVAPDGQEGLIGFVGYLQSLENPITIKPVRVLQQNDLVVIHSKYSMDGPKAIFDLFRVADDKLVEHWDGIQEIPAQTASGRTMTDGPTEIVDQDKTETNEKLVVGFVTDVLMNGEADQISHYIGDVYNQHNPNVEDGLEGLGKFIGYLAENNISFGYSKIHNVVAEGNFVFTQSEGDFDGKPTAFYDLFRVAEGKIVEHWDVVQEIPSEMAHDNGMF